MSNPEPSFQQLDRSIGAVVGSAVGDALGAGYEFASPPMAEEVALRRGTLTGQPPGWWTDDTAMAYGVLEVAANRGEVLSKDALNEIGERFLDWYRSGPPDVGMWTRRVLSRARSGSELEQLATAALADSPNSAGNGSLMRTGPVALAHLGDPSAVAEAARRVSSLTHPHKDAVEACVLWSVAIERSISTGELVGPESGLAYIELSRREWWRSRIAEAERVDPSTFNPNGWAVTALQAAWAAIVAASGKGRPFETGLREAVSIGDDTDTVAAIAGALLGAAHGFTSIPFSWRRGLAGWPPGANTFDLVSLTTLAVRHAVPDAAGWPTVHSMQDAYRAFGPQGLSLSFTEDDSVLFGDVAALPEVDADAFLSLCRIGRGDLRGDDHHLIWLLDGPDNLDSSRAVSDAADAIEELRADRMSVFVHCVRAESRTPAVALVWLTRHRGLSSDEALNLVLNAFPGINQDQVLALAGRPR